MFLPNISSLSHSFSSKSGSRHLKHPEVPFPDAKHGAGIPTFSLKIARFCRSIFQHPKIASGDFYHDFPISIHKNRRLEGGSWGPCWPFSSWLSWWLSLSFQVKQGALGTWRSVLGEWGMGLSDPNKNLWDHQPISYL